MMFLIASEDTVSHLRKVLDLFQKGAYPETLIIDNVVALANTRVGEEVGIPFHPMAWDEVINALIKLVGSGYGIELEGNDKIRFTQYPKLF